MQNVYGTIQLLVAPVVMISACGLLCLALYNRLAAIVSRARAFHKERFDATARLAAARRTGQSDPELEAQRRRTVLLDRQVEQILHRARVVRACLMLLLTTILCMLGCSAGLGLSIFWERGTNVALVFFGLGVAAMMGAVILAMGELTSALDPVLLEATSIEELEQALE